MDGTSGFPGKPLEWRRNEPGWTPLEICESSAFAPQSLWEGEGMPDRPLAGRSASQETCHSQRARLPASKGVIPRPDTEVAMADDCILIAVFPSGMTDIADEQSFPLF